MDKIMERLHSDYNHLTEKGYRVLGVFLQGSQNYGLNYAGSDVDTKAIIIPSIDDVVLNRKPDSHTEVLPSNEHLDRKDIRLMHDCFKKQNINFLEILFTPYRVMNPVYEAEYAPMFEHREDIAHFHVRAALNCLCGMIYEKNKALEHPYPTLIDRIKKFGYDPKQLHHILRCWEFIQRYCEGEKFEDCLQSKHKDLLIAVKDCSSGKAYYSLEDARFLANTTEEASKKYKDKYIEDHLDTIDVYNPIAQQVMSDCLLAVIKKSFAIDLATK